MEIICSIETNNQSLIPLLSHARTQVIAFFCDFWSQRECKGQFSYSGTSEKVLKEAMGEKVHITKAGGAGYKIVELFNGGAESYFHDNKIKKWDICAGEAILRSTCYGKFTDMSGQRIDYR